MQSKRYLVYLRKRRRELGLTQDELAILLGLKSRAYISRLENGKSFPSIEIAIACEIVFGECFCELFPELYAESKEKVITRFSLLNKQGKENRNARQIRKQNKINDRCRCITK